ncbi:MAG: heme-binding protein [Alphaproteobacteria bacterium]|nr:heme-binding protein [Alphaproteobacteria bacterium]
MSAITLAQANRILDAIVKRAAELQTRPISAVVVEPGCVVKAFQKEDGASMVRFEMAYGKAYASLALGRDSSLVKIRSQEKPDFVRYLVTASDDKLFAEGGGKLIRDDKGDVVGAVGVTGDTEERDEELAIHGIRAAGLKIDTDFEGQGRQFIIRRTAGSDGR